MRCATADSKFVSSDDEAFKRSRDRGDVSLDSVALSPGRFQVRSVEQNLDDREEPDRIDRQCVDLGSESSEHGLAISAVGYAFAVHSVTAGARSAEMRSAVPARAAIGERFQARAEMTDVIQNVPPSAQQRVLMLCGIRAAWDQFLHVTYDRVIVAVLAYATARMVPAARPR